MHRSARVPRSLVLLALTPEQLPKDQAKDAALPNVLTPQQFQQYLGSRDEMKQKAEQKLLESGK